MPLLRSNGGGRISGNIVEACVGAVLFTHGGIYWYQEGALSKCMVEHPLV